MNSGNYVSLNSKNCLLFCSIKSRVFGEIAVKDFIDHTEIKTIFVPYEYVRMVHMIVNGKKDKEGTIINIPIQGIPIIV